MSEDTPRVSDEEEQDDGYSGYSGYSGYAEDPSEEHEDGGDDDILRQGHETDPWGDMEAAVSDSDQERTDDSPSSESLEDEEVERDRSRHHRALPPSGSTAEDSTANQPERGTSSARTYQSPASSAEERLLFKEAAAAEQGRFDDKNGVKLGIVGGKGVGKSYLFQAMVYRTVSGEHSGALTYLLDQGKSRLVSVLSRSDRVQQVNLRRFIKNYQQWFRLPQTLLDTQRWYRLQLSYRQGFFGQERGVLEVEFFDGSGEGFFQRIGSATIQKQWRERFFDAEVMVFCLPIWAVFPGHLDDEDWEDRELILEGFEQVVTNFMTMRESLERRQPVSSILALTMADDPRSALKSLRYRWIEPYMADPATYIEKLRAGRGIARYLRNARQVSDLIAAEFRASRDPLVSAIPRRLEFGGGQPWLIPMSAVDGKYLTSIEQSREIGEPHARPRFPVPVHVELPLLVTLCQEENALL